MYDIKLEDLYDKYYNDDSNDEERAEAKRRLVIAAKNGYSDGQYFLGKIYEEVEKNYIEAAIWYENAAKQGLAIAQFNLGWLYQKGKGVEQDYEKAAMWYQKAAEQGNSSAQNNLGWLYEEGKGVEQDYEKAEMWYQKAADQGNSSAQNNLGWLYKEGKGVEQDYEKAAKWYQKAADQGNSSAQNNLGWLYKEGKGVEQDYEKAEMWYQKAANQENGVAQGHLAQLYEEGKGVEQDYEKALIWYQKAAKQGYNKAKIRVNYLRRFKECLETKSIRRLHDISEIWNLELKSETCNFEAIQVDPGEDNDRYAQSHTLYSIEDIKKIMDVVKSILSDVDRVQDDKKNDIDVFMQIYVKLAKLISYDWEYKTKPYTSANMIGGLLKQKCICARVCRNIKKFISLQRNKM